MAFVKKYLTEHIIKSVWRLKVGLLSSLLAHSKLLYTFHTIWCSSDDLLSIAWVLSQRSEKCFPQRLMEAVDVRWLKGEETSKGQFGNMKISKTKLFLIFLSDAEHQRADWVGIHERICQLLVPIRSQTQTSCQLDSHIEMQVKKVRVNMT